MTAIIDGATTMAHNLHMNTVDAASLLAQTKPFGEAAPAHLRRLAGTLTQRRYRPGESVAMYETWQQSVWFASQGVLRTVNYPTSGGQATVSVAGPRALLGCLDASCQRRHWLECFAVTEATVAFLSRPAFQSAVRGDHGLCLGLLRLAVERLWEERELRTTCSLPSRPRTVAMLLYLYRRLGHRIPLTRRALADACALTRETTIRVLSPLEKQGAIRSERGALEIVKPDALEALLRERN